MKPPAVSAEREDGRVDDLAVASAGNLSTSPHTPGTPLPWRVIDDGETFYIEQVVEPDGDIAMSWDKQNAAYVVHAANAYPHLVAALHAILAAGDFDLHGCEELATELLRGLGELS